MTNYPDLKQYAAELAELENAPLAPIEIHPLGAIAIISHIQLATRHPSVSEENDSLTKIAIDVARQLQSLFDPESVTSKVLELGWNPDDDILVTSEDACGEPCELKKEPKLIEAIKNYFEWEGIDLDEDISFGDTALRITKD